jgi:hypothetical protein
MAQGCVSAMLVIELDGSGWSERLDFWDALRQALGVVPAHGTSFAAFVDSIFYNQEMLNVVPPFVIYVKNPHAEARPEVEQMSSILADARAWRKANYGDDVEASLLIAT